MIITLEEAKQYLRVDTEEDDALIEQAILSAEGLCADVARVDRDTLEEEPEIMRTAVLYALAYLYEHREEADHHALTLSLRYLLFGVRREGF